MKTVKINSRKIKDLSVIANSTEEKGNIDIKHPDIIADRLCESMKNAESVEIFLSNSYGVFDQDATMKHNIAEGLLLAVRIIANSNSLKSIIFKSNNNDIKLFNERDIMEALNESSTLSFLKFDMKVNNPQEFGEAIKNSTTLNEIHFRNNKMNGIDVLNFVEGISESKTITDISINGNNINNNTLNILDKLSNMDQLTQLNLMGNSLYKDSNITPESLSKAVVGISSLQKINLIANFSFFGKEIRDVQALKNAVLDRYNDISDELKSVLDNTEAESEYGSIRIPDDIIELTGDYFENHLEMDIS